MKTENKEPQGKHIGYIYPFETYLGKKIIDKKILLSSYFEENKVYNLIVDSSGRYILAKEIVESFEKYYEPVEEPITIGGVEVKIDNNLTFFDGGWYMNKAMLEYLVKNIKSEPNLAEKLQLIINKMEAKCEI